MKALLKAEDFIKKNNNQAKEIIKNKFNYEFDYNESSFAKHRFIVKIPQALLLTMEDQARWRIDNKLTDKTEIPNYLMSLYLDELKGLKPEAVTVIH